MLLLKFFITLKKTEVNTKLTFQHFKRRRIEACIVLSLFLFPSIIFIIGLSPISAAVIEIDINNQRGDDKGTNEIQLSFYATLGSYDYLTKSKILNALNGEDVGDGDLEPVEILLLVRESELEDSSNSKKLAHIIHNCTDSGLDVWIWFVYTLENGYYPSLEDYEYLPEFKELFDEWVENNSLDIEGILFDNELDQDIPDLSSVDLYNSLKNIMLKREKGKKEWDDAADTYDEIAEDWSDDGYKIALVGSDFTLFDLKDDDPDIQQLFGLVNNPPDMWDRVSFMLYRGCEYHTNPWGQDYLYNLADLHKKTYGDRAVVAIGCMAYAAYTEIDDILEDIAILKLLEYDLVELFEFRAFYVEFGYDGLVEVLESSLKGWKHPKFYIYFSTLEYFSRTLLFLTDILLDFY